MASALSWASYIYNAACLVGFADGWTYRSGLAGTPTCQEGGIGETNERPAPYSVGGVPLLRSLKLVQMAVSSFFGAMWVGAVSNAGSGNSEQAVLSCLPSTETRDTIRSNNTAFSFSLAHAYSVLLYVHCSLTEAVYSPRNHNHTRVGQPPPTAVGGLRCQSGSSLVSRRAGPRKGCIALHGVCTHTYLVSRSFPSRPAARVRLSPAPIRRAPPRMRPAVLAAVGAHQPGRVDEHPVGRAIPPSITSGRSRGRPDGRTVQWSTSLDVVVAALRLRLAKSH